MQFLRIENEEALYRATLDIRNQIVYTSAITYEEAIEHAKHFPADRQIERYAGLEDGQVVARLVVEEDRATEGKPIHLAATAAPDRPDRLKEALLFGMERGNALGATRFLADLRSDLEDWRTVYHSLGFEEAQRNPNSQLDLATFDPEPWLARARSLEGFEVTSVAEAVAREGEAFYERYWKLHMAIGPDIPSPEPFVETPYAEFTSWFKDPYLDQTTLFIGLLNGELVACSEFGRNRVDPTRATTYLTGVRREHRRKGIAATLKGVALTKAKELGVRYVTTDNEENNPMFDLNIQLGFREIFAWIFVQRPA